MAGSGPAVLLFHAGLTDRRMWDPQWPALVERFTAIRFDARGFGASRDPVRPYAMHADALEVLDAVEVERAALVGASMGGGAAIDLALGAPHRVAALVAVNATYSGLDWGPELEAALEAVEAAYESRGIEAANELEMRLWVDGPLRSPGDVDGELRRQLAATNGALLERQAAWQAEPADPEPPAAQRLGELGCPALVVAGELDQPSVLAAAVELARATGGELVEIPGAGHLPSLERPRAFLDAVLPFLERAGRAA